MNEANTMADILGRNESVDEASARLQLTAPRVTPADIEANIARVEFFTAAQGCEGRDDTGELPDDDPLRLLTICILVTRNGFTVIGHSAPASPENYREELGRRYAKENAVRQLWPLMGYALREDLHRSANAMLAFSPEAQRQADREALARGGVVDDPPPAIAHNPAEWVECTERLTSDEHEARGHRHDLARDCWLMRVAPK